MTRPRNHFYFCPTCGREYAFPGKLRLATGCIDCGDYLKPLQLPSAVKDRRAREMPPTSGNEERQRESTYCKHSNKKAGCQ